MGMKSTIRSREHPIFTGQVPVGIMSADNPLYDSSHRGGTKGLVQRLKLLGLKHDIVRGKYNSPETSFLIYNPDRKIMLRLGKDFGQESVIYSESGSPQLIYTNGPHTGKHNPSRGVEFMANPPENFFTSLPGGGHFRIDFDFDKLEEHALASSHGNEDEIKTNPLKE